MTYALDTPRLMHEYEAGRSVATLARELGVDSSTVRSRLAAAGVTLRGRAGATRANLDRDPTIRSRMGRPRRYPVNPGWFDRHTPDVAYTVGLFQADGSNDTGRGYITITLKAADAPHLDRVAAVMGAPRELVTDQYGGRRFSIHHRVCSAGLAGWGVVSPKTYTATTDPRLMLDRDYWRGVVDGDGTLHETPSGRRILALVGARPLVSEFLAFCRHHGAGGRCSVRPHRNIWTVRLSGTEAARMARIMYRKASLSLPRKQCIADRWE